MHGTMHGADLGRNADVIPASERSRMTGAFANESFKRASN